MWTNTHSHKLLKVDHVNQIEWCILCKAVNVAPHPEVSAKAVCLVSALFSCMPRKSRTFANPCVIDSSEGPWQVWESARRNHMVFSNGKCKSLCPGGLPGVLTPSTSASWEMTGWVATMPKDMAPGWTSANYVFSVERVQTAFWDTLGWPSSAGDKVVSPHIYHWWGNIRNSVSSFSSLVVQEIYWETRLSPMEDTKMVQDLLLTAHIERLRKVGLVSLAEVREKLTVVSSCLKETAEAAERNPFW